MKVRVQHTESHELYIIMLISYAKQLEINWTV